MGCKCGFRREFDGLTDSKMRCVVLRIDSNGRSDGFGLFYHIWAVVCGDESWIIFAQSE